MCMNQEFDPIEAAKGRVQDDSLPESLIGDEVYDEFARDAAAEFVVGRTVSKPETEEDQQLRELDKFEADLQLWRQAMRPAVRADFDKWRRQEYWTAKALPNKAAIRKTHSQILRHRQHAEIIIQEKRDLDEDVPIELSRFNDAFGWLLERVESYPRVATALKDEQSESYQD